MTSIIFIVNMIKKNHLLQSINLQKIILICIMAFSPVSYALSPHPVWLQESLKKLDQLNDKNPRLALEFTKTLLNKPTQPLDNIGKAALYARVAEYNYYLGLLDESQHYINMFYGLKTNLSTKDGITLLITHADVLDAQGTSKQAMTLYRQAKKYAEDIEDKKLLAESYSAIASAYSANHNDTEALKNYHQAYLLTHELGDELDIAYLNIQMSRSYSYIYDDEKAVQLANEAIRYFHANEYYFDELFAQNTLANIYMPMKEFDKAISTYQRVLDLSKRVEKENLADVAYLGLANAYLKKKQNDKARHYFELYEKNHQGSITPFTQLSDLILSAQIAFADKEISFAEDNIKQAEAVLANLDKEKVISWHIQLLDFKADIAVYKEDFKNAYFFQKETRKLFKSYQNSEREKVRSRYKVMFDTDQALLKNQLLERDMQLDKAELESAAQQQKLQTLLISAVSIFALSLMFFIYRQRKNSKILHKLANTDVLTELANRRYTFIYAENMLAQAKKYQQNFAIIIFDIDHFKKINDAYGHTGGDIALKSIANIANEYVRSNDILGRIGGEEFLVILPSTSSKQAYDIAERIRQGIEKADITLGDEIVNTSASFGISQLAQNQPNFNQIFHEADMALYQAKNNGRNCIILAG
ncbi:tetratricopeptide repeat-containing diguanylate cyclase [Colwellia sp. TT2012]|uniref:tetratricopeptide repeat-containing diguanylate cyclase n=1 Tax=Colwellia sp. TT2012 TaxID=1720342 RepID=UPI00070BE087|nr:tetratricopeptide repeat-containing diguanylate cyclase [Colwellia sp. TT2012]